MKTLSVLLKKDFMDLLRNGKLLIMGAIFLLFGILSPLSAKYMPEIVAHIGASQDISISIPEPTWLDAAAQYIKNMTQICAFIVIIVFMGWIAKDKEEGILAFILVKPLSRSMYIASKFIAAAFVVILAVLVSSSIAFYYTLIFFDEFEGVKFISFSGVVTLYFLYLLVLVLLMSTLFSSQITAGIASFALWMVFGLLAEVDGPGQLFPSKILEQGNYILMGEPLNWLPFLVVILWIALCFFLSVIKFKSWEA
jgi:ABC-2 type transport system permease protein